VFVSIQHSISVDTVTKPMEPRRPTPVPKDSISLSGLPQHSPSEADLTVKQFNRLSKLAYDRYGLNIVEKKRFMVSNRLMKLQRRFKFADMEALLEHYQMSKSREDALDLFDVLSTNLTHFFREAQHLDLMVQNTLKNAKESGNRKIRIWSAGCSRGCEPYSIVISLLEAIPNPEEWDIRVLATDLSVTQIDLAKRASYGSDAIRAVTPQVAKKYFDHNAETGDLSVKRRVKEYVTFAILNLLDPWKMHGPFDAIFCRNVMIYFDDATREKLTTRFTTLMRPESALFLGCSESLTGNHDSLLRISPSSYRKVS
jgi:chemotaxis protein methyltransferase CheR